MTEAYETVNDGRDRDAWLAARRTGVGASDTPVLLGLVSWSSPVALWGVKTGRLTEDEDGESERMRWGRQLESIVAEEYERVSGRSLQRWGALLRSKEWPWLTCTPDYKLVPFTDDPLWPDGWGNPVEIKTTDASRKKDWIDGPPPHVVAQVQHQLAVTGAAFGSVGVLVGGNTFRWADVPRDEEMIARIVSETAAFWRYVTEDTPPPMDGSEATASAIAGMWPVTAEGEELVLPDSAYDWAREWDAASADVKLAQERLKAVQNTVKGAMGNAEVGLYPDGETAFTWRTVHRKGYTVQPSQRRQLRKVKVTR